MPWITGIVSDCMNCFAFLNLTFTILKSPEFIRNSFLEKEKNYLVYLKGKRRSGMREEVRGFLLFGSLRDGRIGAVR